MVKSGLLTDIVYPTGGTTHFEFEPNDYGYIGSAPIADIKFAPQTKLARAELLTANQNLAIDSAFFRISTRQPVDFGIYINSGDGSRSGTFANGHVYCKCLTCDTRGYSLVYPVYETLSVNKSVQIILEPGRYKLYSYCRRLRPDSLGVASINVSYKDSTGVTLNQTGGGVRVRRITSSAGLGAPPVVKKYSYRTNAEPSRSSGSAVTPIPTYSYRYSEDVTSTDTGGPVTILYQMLTSTSGPQMELTQGGMVGYKEVTVVEESNLTAGKTVHKFSSPCEFPDSGDGYEFPFAPNNSTEHYRGKELETSYYRYINGNYELVSNAINKYSFGSSRTEVLSRQVVGLKMGYVYRCNTGLVDCDQFQGQMYRYHSEWLYPTLTTEYRYAPGNDTSNYVKTSTRLRYANPLHKQLTSREVAASNGKVASTLYRYPLDFTIPTGVTPDEVTRGIQTLQSLHVVNVPLEQQLWRRSGTDSTLVDAQLTHYAGTNPRRILRLATSLPLTSINFTPGLVTSTGIFRQDARYQEAVLFEQYDSHGNLLQQRRALDKPTSYLWGYSGMLPVAQIHNATYTQVQQRLQSLGINLNMLTTDAQLLQAIAQLRAGLPKALITSFTYKPLIGINSQTDPSGRTTTYEYDALGRLLRTRDEQGRILSQQQYHYAR